MKWPLRLPPGPKFVAGQVVGGLIVLTRDDGSTHTVSHIDNIYFTEGSIVDNGDGTFSIDLPEG